MTKACRVDRRDRPQRQPPAARLSRRRRPRQGLQPPLRPEGVRRASRSSSSAAATRRWRPRSRSGRPGRTSRSRYRKKEFARPEARERREAPRAREEPDGPTSRSSTRRSERVTTATGKFMKAAGRSRSGVGAPAARHRGRADRAASARSSRTSAGEEHDLPNNVVFTMLGREAPLEFFRRSGIPIRGEWRPVTYVSFAAFFSSACSSTTGRRDGAVNQYFQEHALFPYNVPAWLERAGGGVAAVGTRRRSSGRSRSR